MLRYVTLRYVTLGYVMLCYVTLRYVMVWCGVVWCGVVWCGVVWCGVVWCGVMWCGVVWYGTVVVRHGALRSVSNPAPSLLPTPRITPLRPNILLTHPALPSISLFSPGVLVLVVSTVVQQRGKGRARGGCVGVLVPTVVERHSTWHRGVSDALQCCAS